MIRSFIVLLLLAVFFLSGMLYGVDRGNSETPSVEKENNVVETVEDEPGLYDHDSNTAELTAELSKTEQQNFTQQTASFLEAGVKGLYDVIVHILYQFAQLFF